ncbi:response regulator [Pontibacillus marinus]|uniref:LuxR family transcriptional regulator n=1 Tax=Pontibacillus marinus BH030004 = DSM 16465 TaxID=1385511 RepID=A0A0A5G1H2_9BACI|nr:response regulator transcription factor [Pontibacillus marinus]KGX85894.1 LuxR family transcriptional regulator [Pontibacillus marinus BH030004 = DSM 16465]
MAIKILIADDHQVVRKGLVFFFQTQTDIEVVAEASNGKEALDIIKVKEIDVALLDVQMPEMDGVEAAKAIRAENDQVKIMMLTSFSDYDSVIPAIQAGANGYQLKDVEPDELAEAIRRVVKGESTITAKAASHLMTHVTGDNEKEERAKIDSLTKRESDVLKEIMKGKSNKEISSSLYITEKTVKTHVSNILSKLEVHDRTQAALFAVKYLKKA